MGLLANWGIHLLDTADADIKRVGQRLGFMPLSWRQVVMTNPSRDGLMWRIPDPTVPMASTLFKVQAIMIAEYERVMVLRDGVLEGEEAILPPGLYDIRRTTSLRGQIEVIWFTTREFQLRWGVGDVLTKDRVTIGASGYYNAALVDPEMFLRNVAGNEQVYKDLQLLNFAKPHVSAAIRNLMARKTVMEFQLALPEFQAACNEALMPRFGSWGLEFRGLTIEAQNIPEEFRQAAQQQVIVSMAKEAQIEGAKADITLAQLEAQKAQFAALAEANHLRFIGAANAEIMQNQLNLGLDPLELQKIEAIKILAEHPSEGTLVDNRPQIISQLQPQLPILSPPPVIVTGSPLVAPLQYPPVTGSLPVKAPSEQPDSAESLSREKIEAMLDKLDERFANGEISEQVYLTLQNKWQKRLEKL
jgi:regulator of protease activity HflC (stomatin/prohibitin superfamily)